MSDLRAWMGYPMDGAANGAALVFARNYQEARLMAWSPLSELGVEWIDVRACLLECQGPAMLHCDGKPSGTLSIPDELVCSNCHQWGPPMEERPGGPLCPVCDGSWLEWQEGGS